MASSKTLSRNKIKRRVRGRVFGTAEKPRMSVFKSNKQIYVQLIDDNNGTTLAEASSINMKDAQNVAKIDQAKMVGTVAAERALANGIEKVVFDRNGYLYHGRVKALADAAREGGLKF